MPYASIYHSDHDFEKLLIDNNMFWVIGIQLNEEYFHFAGNLATTSFLHFVVLECLSSKSLEWNVPIWFASLDLTKAFDRVYSPLFDALLQQGVPRCYCTLVWKLCKGQTGSVHGSERFNIECGVKQGDVISPIFFNAGLEHAMRKWKAKLVHHGVQLGHGSRLTNIRYVDDLMFVATSSNDLIYMLEALIPELAACGLQLNSGKTKILTMSPSESSEFVDVCGEMVKVIHAETVHKHLGRNLSGNFLARRNFVNLHIVCRLLGTNFKNTNISY